MEKHLLVAVSDQESAMHGVRFVGDFFSGKEDIRVTLFYTAPRPMDSWERTRDTEEAQISGQLTRQYEAKGRKAMERARRDLLRAGFPESNLDTKLHARRISKVMDLIQEGEKGLYDAVVLGRRGLSWLEEAFEDSVSSGLLEKRCNFPLWMCRRSEEGRRNVLLCVDGSEAAYRIADHVGFMLENEREHEVSVLTVKGKTNGDKDRTEEILSRTRENLLKNGVPSEQIRTDALVSDNIANAILRAADEGGFAAMALGRRGTEEGFLRKIFSGSVSSRVFRGLERSSLWVCY